MEAVSAMKRAPLCALLIVVVMFILGGQCKANPEILVPEEPAMNHYMGLFLNMRLFPSVLTIRAGNGEQSVRWAPVITSFFDSNSETIGPWVFYRRYKHMGIVVYVQDDGMAREVYQRDF